jgi:S-methylmethionine-dependent homocysteine/selenocysteine methylase
MTTTASNDRRIFDSGFINLGFLLCRDYNPSMSIARMSITLLDGGTGRELLRMGAPFRQPEWSALALMEAPVFVARVHEAFIDAGAEVITTNSYAIVPFHIGAECFVRDGARLAALAGRLGREAADAGKRRVLVAGSLPPICGSYRAEWFEPKFARPILATLVDGLQPFVDHWQAETISCIEEAELVREVIGRDAKPLWLAFTLRDDAAARLLEPQLRSGQRVVDAVAAAISLSAQAILFNCSQPEVMGAAVSIARQRIEGSAQPGAARLRIGVYANAFAIVRKQAQANSELSEIRSDLTPQGYLAWVNDWFDRGADIVGGCCGIGPEHIRAIRESISARFGLQV